MSVVQGMLPPAASDLSAQWDRLFYSMTALTGAVAGGLLVLLILFSIRYRRGSRVDRGPTRARHWLEWSWTLIPLLLFFGVYVWGASLYADFYRKSEATVSIFVVARQWMWKLQHPDGRREIDQLHLLLGQPVELVLTSEDVIHSFYVPAFRVKQDAVPGRYTTIRFTPTLPGEYRLECAEFCGADHARMLGSVFVLKPARYAAWLAQTRGGVDMIARGRALFRQKGCSGCHEQGSTVHAPDLDAVYGRTVHLEDGRTVTVDDAYLRDAMMLPSRDLVAGYPDRMPSFQGQLSESEILDLIAYLKSRGASP